MKSVRKTVRLSDALAGRIDAARGDVSWSRWVERALEQALAGAGKPDRPVVGTPAAVVRPRAPARVPANETAVQRNIRLADERRARLAGL